MRTKRQYRRLQAWLDATYAKYHRTEWIGSDPLRFVHLFHDPLDQEVAGLLAASLAYGQVASINASVDNVLRRMGGRPSAFVRASSEAEIGQAMSGFRHRWTGEDALTDLLMGIQRVVREYGSLGQAFSSVDRPEEPGLQEALGRWVALLRGGPGKRVRKELLAIPERNSACKRLHLYMRWMVRKDAIDSGCWHGRVDPSRLLIPLDTHVYRFACRAGLTRRASADARTVAEITGVFRCLQPDDPVRYDFSLTRPGIIEGWSPVQGFVT